MDSITTYSLQISEVAKRAKVSIRTVRYYDEQGLLPPSNYTSGGIRLYDIWDVNRLIFIRRLKTLGLSIKKIKECLGQSPYSPDRQTRVNHTLEILRLQKKKTREEIEKLFALEREIDSSIERVTLCSGCKTEECPESCPGRGSALK